MYSMDILLIVESILFFYFYDQSSKNGICIYNYCYIPL